MVNFNAESVLTLAQALQLVGLAPCLFVVAFLLGMVRKNPQALIPIGYFLSLACGFALPLADIFISGAHDRMIAGLLFGESVLVAFSFLLILQFLIGRVPPLPYWLVLAIPLVGGGSMIYASLMQGSEACLRDQVCMDVQSVRTLYNIFSSAMVFLLLVYYSSRFKGMESEDIVRRHKYWLIVALIAVHLLVLAVDLARLGHHLTVVQAQFTETVFRLTFIYLVITSLFRVFFPALATKIIEVPVGRAYDHAADLTYAETIKTLLTTQRAYREMRLNRARLAKKVGIGEHHLSRVINHHFGMSFNELINGYRIEEAKERLKGEATPITTIAFEVGFNSIASFNRVFKAKVGVSPTEFRSGLAA